MKKLFLPIVLLSACYVYADENISTQPVELTTEQKEIQVSILKSAQEIYNAILQIPAIREKWENFSDAQKNDFEVVCVKFAELRYIVSNQYTLHFNEIFKILTDLTDNDSWRSDISFVSEGYILQAQAQQNAKEQDSLEEDSLDEDFDDKN